MPNHPTPNLLDQAGQSHLNHFLGDQSPLSQSSKAHLRDQLATLDWATIAEMRALIKTQTPNQPQTPQLQPQTTPPQTNPDLIEPAPMIELASTTWPFKPNPIAVNAEAHGREMYRQGKVGHLLLAGGQGTRLGFDSPKGLYPILQHVTNAATNLDPIYRTLFAILTAGVRDAQAFGGPIPPLALMTSPETHAPTVAAFDAAKNFHLPTDRVRFFQQGTLPAMDSHGRLLIAPEGGLALAPDGHGGAISGLLRSETLAWFESHGCKWLITFQVDNPAARIADPAFVGTAAATGSDALLKVVRKTEPSERVGVVALKNHKPAIVEYSELSEAQAHQRANDGSLAFKAGSIAFNIFNLAFISRVATAAATDQKIMPLHLAHKRVTHINLNGETISPQSPNAFKAERFIFDTLPHAARVSAYEVARSREFLPVKDATGVNSPESIARGIDQEWASYLTTKPAQVSLTPESWQARWRE